METIKKNPKWFFALFVLAILIAVPLSLHEIFVTPNLLEQIKQNGQLRVLIRNSATTYYEGREGLEGYEYDLTQAFAQHLGVNVEYKVLDSVDDIMLAVQQGQASLAAAGITRLKSREQYGLFGPEYMQVHEQLVCNRKGPRPKSLAELDGIDILVASGTSYINTLENIKASMPTLQWRTTDELSTEQILANVGMKQLDCTVADSNVIAINRRYYPELKVRMDLSEAQSLAWLLPESAEALQLELERWLINFRNSGKLQEIYEHYYAYTRIFDYVDIRSFKRRIKKRLPKYRRYFEQAAEQQNLPWTLLAAQSYQESHWNPYAKSPTGVRGIMMLTLNTAKSLGITDRLDAKQNIFAGARYLRKMIDRIPDHINEDDRTWLALAAYNVGMGHIHDAQTLARQLDKDPEKWLELRQVLPLLTQKRYYKTLKYGYARGTEPVEYVTRIRNYQDILENSNKNSN